MQNFTPQQKSSKTFLFTSIGKIIAFIYTAKKRGAIFLLLSLLAYLPGFAQNGASENKIDPVFRRIIAQAKAGVTNTAAQRNFLPHSGAEPTEGFVSGNASAEKRYDCIVYTKNAQALLDNDIVVNSELPDFVTAWATLDQILQMAAMTDVRYIDAPRVCSSNNDIAVGNSGASLLHQGRLNNTVYKGRGVIVAIFDSGIDWDHFDFRDPADTTKSRILRIWDQTITAVAGEVRPAGFSYGVEYTQAQINNELDGTPANFVRERDINGHGTHVAGTAAGNGSALPSRKYAGMAPEADLVIIKGGDGSFPTNRIIDALTYLHRLATTLGKPVVLNMSLGGQFGPHDGTNPEEYAVNNFTASALGRSVVIAAGNDNGSNIHNKLNLAGGATASVLFTVPAVRTGADLFAYNIYSYDTSNISVTMTAPDGSSVTAGAGQAVSRNVLNDSFTVYLENGIDPANGDRYVDVYVARNGSNTGSPGGTWTLSLRNNTTNSLTMDGWMYYRNPSFGAITLIGGDNNYLVGSPGNAAAAITVASFTGRNNWYSDALAGGFTFPAVRHDSISSFSSRGPRRDGLLKPDIAATGEVVVSSLSSNSPVNPAFVTNAGLYRINQGTSMSAPVVTGAVALLLQAAPDLAGPLLKILLTSTANKDALTELTGPTPNTTWGHGRLDVFKAASLLFNCSRAERKTYAYDAPTRNAQESGTTFTTQRIAVRFTPDISGKLGGIFFHTSLTATGLVAEVRTNNGGNPGTLLGSLNIPGNQVARYTWNYVDLNNLNVAVTNASDYFIVLARHPDSTANWSLRGEAIALDNRSLISTNGGASWSNAPVDYKIRSVVYNNGQSGNIVMTNATDTTNVITTTNTNYYLLSNCAFIAQIVAAGPNTVSGNVAGQVWIENSVPNDNNSNPFVSRHYEIIPASGASGTTGRVTLYFTQAEFTAFNASPGSTLDLPANPTDSAGKANLTVAQYSGTSSDGTGLPSSYSGAPVIINPDDADIVWNKEYNRWEVSFDVTGWGGFIVQANGIKGRVNVEYFKGSQQGTANVLDWKVGCINTAAVFEVQRSGEGGSFNSISTISTTQVRCVQPFDFKDVSPLPGNNYYRVKITESNGIVRYTDIVMLYTNRLLVSTLYPTLISKGAAVQVSYAGHNKGSLVITDGVGRQVYRRVLTGGVQTISLPLLASGTYLYSIKEDNKVTVASGKLIVE
jgi:subtilisin family serine protease